MPTIDTYRTVLSIDPASRNLGYAVFRSEGEWKLEEAELIKQRGDDWVDNVDAMVRAIGRVAKKWYVSECVIEQPELFLSSGRGKGASNSGSILKLMGCVFAIRQAMLSAGVRVTLVPVHVWKGTVPKVITLRRMRRRWGWDGDDLNISDSIGVGDWYIRRGRG